MGFESTSSCNVGAPSLCQCPGGCPKIPEHITKEQRCHTYPQNQDVQLCAPLAILLQAIADVLKAALSFHKLLTVSYA